MKTRGVSSALAVVALCAGSMLNAQGTNVSDLHKIAEQTYLYAYPLVLIEATHATMPTNHLIHISAFPDASFRTIVRPNADTLYSTAWIDVSKEPMLLHVADSGGRFYLLQFMDAWTETFADPGKRTSGTGEMWVALVGPGWSGKLPEHVVRYDAPTNLVWLLGRTQTNGTADYDNVHAFQHGMWLVPLSQFPGADEKPHPPVTRPLSTGPTVPEQVKAMEPVQFFAAFAKAMKTNPPHKDDAPMVEQMARIGLVPGQDFDASKLTPEQLAAVNEGAHAAAAGLETLLDTPKAQKPGWNSLGGMLGRYGTNYRARAVVARIAVGANPPEDAVYLGNLTDVKGEPLNGSMRYRMHFAAEQIPPVLAFWSITAYDKDGYFIANPINRYAIGDRDALKFNADGSLDLYIQAEKPAPEQASNWLPSGDGSFNLTMRLYWPKPAILEGSWHPPAVERMP
jgi:hypothetical protein